MQLIQHNLNLIHLICLALGLFIGISITREASGWPKWSVLFGLLAAPGIVYYWRQIGMHLDMETVQGQDHAIWFMAFSQFTYGMLPLATLLAHFTLGSVCGHVLRR